MPHFGLRGPTGAYMMQHGTDVLPNDVLTFRVFARRRWQWKNYVHESRALFSPISFPSPFSRQARFPGHSTVTNASLIILPSNLRPKNTLPASFNTDSVVRWRLQLPACLVCVVPSIIKEDANWCMQSIRRTCYRLAFSPGTSIAQASFTCRTSCVRNLFI